MSFSDHFSGVAVGYAQFRPHYPEALFAWLASITPSHDLVWDCAAGNGQASVDLARYFARVIATDASAAQIEAATPHERVEYRVGPAEESGLPDASLDLLTVAQALHWFDLPRFWREAARVLKPNAILAIWTYGVMHIDGTDVDPILQHYYYETIFNDWPAERRLVESGYVGIPMPFPELEVPPFEMQASWDLNELLGYISTWSGTSRALKAGKGAQIDAFAKELASAWGDASTKRTVLWPLAVRVARHL